jgi:hypothetical protein
VSQTIRDATRRAQHICFQPPSIDDRPNHTRATLDVKPLRVRFILGTKDFLSLLNFLLIELAIDQQFDALDEGTTLPIEAIPYAASEGTAAQTQLSPPCLPAVDVVILREIVQHLMHGRAAEPLFLVHQNILIRSSLRKFPTQHPVNDVTSANVTRLATVRCCDIGTEVFQSISQNGVVGVILHTLLRQTSNLGWELPLRQRLEGVPN